MQHRPDVHDVRVGVPGLADRLVEPALQLPALLRRVHVLVVFDIVQDDQVRPPVPVLAAADLLAGSHRVHLDVRPGKQHAGAPRLVPALLAEVLQDRAVLFQFRPDVLQECFGLVGRVRQDQDVVLVLVEDRVQAVLEREVRALGVSSGRGRDHVAALLPVDLLPVRLRIQPLEDTAAPQPVQLLVELRRPPHEVVRQVSPAEVSQVDRRQRPAHALRPGQRPAVHVFVQQPQALLLVRPLPARVLQEQFRLVVLRPLQLRVRIVFVQPGQPFLYVNHRLTSAPSPFSGSPSAAWPIPRPPG